MSNGENDPDPRDKAVSGDTEIGSAPGRPGRFTTETVVSKLGVSIEALRRYEALGLVSPVSFGKVKVYDQSDCDRLTLILRDRAMTKALDRIAHLLEDASIHPTTDFERARTSCEDLIVRMEAQRSDISMILAHLRRIYIQLTLKTKAAPDRNNDVR